jgi:hypothetical protein
MMMALALVTKIKDRLRQTMLVQEALRNPINLGPMWLRARTRMISGAVMLGLGFLFGLPGVAFCVAAYFYLQNPIWLAIAPTMYAFSWVLWIVAFFLMGAEAMKHRRLLGMWLLRMLLRPWQPANDVLALEAVPISAGDPAESSGRALAVGDRRHG